MHVASLGPDNSWECSPEWWKNFIRYLDESGVFTMDEDRRQPVKEGLAEFSGCWSDCENYLVFESEEDFLMFKLKFS